MAKNYGWMIKMTNQSLSELYESGLSSRKIAELVGGSRQTIDRKLKLCGVKMRSKKEIIKLKGHGAAWKGGRYKSHGYVYVYSPNHPNCTKQGYVLEHRLVMEEKLGRYLLPSEQPHHDNGINDDNRPENLKFTTVDGHTMLTMYCKNCDLRKRVKTLEWQVRHLNKLLYGTEKPSVMDILRRGLEDE